MGARRTRFAHVAALLGLAACTEHVAALPEVGKPESIRLTVLDTQRGSPTMRKPFSLTGEDLMVDIEALDVHGQRMTSFQGWIELRMEPGDVTGVTSADGTMFPGPEVKLTNGASIGTTVHVAQSISDARLWGEDIGYEPTDPSMSACSNGRDDDGDGLVDYPMDPGCQFANDNDETGGSHAAGVSDILYYQNPTLADTQGYTGVSPLNGRLVTVDSGFMIVTRITSDGFFLSDVELDASGAPTTHPVPWGSMFVYNYNNPPYLRACDHILTLSGSIGEFFGFTELNQPSWRREKWCPPGLEGTDACIGANGLPLTPGPCPMPEPIDLGPALLGTANMESVESSLVRVRQAKIATRFSADPPPMGSNCDLNGNGAVEFTNVDEAACNDACTADPECSEWTAWLQHGQFVIRAGDHTLNAVTSASAPDFDPLMHRGETFAAFTGTMRNFSPLGPERGYILEPRCADDITPMGQAIPEVATACVVPRTGGEIEPD